MRISDALKRKDPKETIFERERRLRWETEDVEKLQIIEKEIATRAILEEQAALEDERQNDMLDFIHALDEPMLQTQPTIEPVISPVIETTEDIIIPNVRKPPVKRKRKETKAERNAKAAKRMQLNR